ncbi:MAG: glucosamine inositolphosphorylceramide transferase family protein, partial [Pseudomonadales bacterium]
MIEEEKLRVGILLDGYQVPAWQHLMIEKIKYSDFANIVLVVLPETGVNLGHSAKKSRSNPGDFGGESSRPGERLFKKGYDFFIERNPSVQVAKRKVDCENLLGGIDTLICNFIDESGHEKLSSPDISEIDSYKPHILLQCSSTFIAGDLYEIPEYGIWWLYLGDSTAQRVGPVGFWESIENRPAMGSELWVRGSKYKLPKLIYKSYSTVNGLSFEDNISRVCWKSAVFIPRKMRELFTMGPDSFYRKAELEFGNSPANCPERNVLPSNIELLGFLSKKILEKSAHLFVANTCLSQWILMFDIKNEHFSHPSTHQKILPPKDRFYADPHIILKDGKYYIFIEELIYEENKGFISVITMDEAGNYTAPETVLERPYHLSYPNVFQHEGQFYMVPETEANGTIELYKCLEFP